MTLLTEQQHRSHADSVRDQLITMLLHAEDFVSGERLCEALGMTRTAVWKHIRALEGLGFGIERRHGVGYRITDCPDLLLEPLLAPATEGLSIGHSIHWLSTTRSTNEDASKLAGLGAPHGTIVTALQQVGGKGRGGKPWTSPVGGLWQSILVRCDIPLHRAAELTLMTSVAVRRALMATTGLPISIKWPNDLLCRDKKLCGILVEIQSEAESVAQAIIGIGINTNVERDQIAPELRDKATSVLIESGAPIRHLDFEQKLLCEMDAMLTLISPNGPGFAAVSEEWRNASSTLGRQVRIFTGGQVVEGYALDFDNQGVLLLQTPTGITRILSGDVLF